MHHNRALYDIVVANGIYARELHGNGDGGNTADFPREPCGNTARMESSVEGLPR